VRSTLLIAVILFLAVTPVHADEKTLVKEALATLTLDTAPLVLLKADVDGDATANLILAEASFHGVLLIKSNTEALKWYLRAASHGSAMAENVLGYFYDNGIGVKRDPNQAAAWYLKAAQHGYPAAWFNIASCYEYGIGVAQNFQEAARWYGKSAQTGDAEAQLKLAILFERGVVEGAEPEQCYEWLRRAAEQGNIIAAQKLEHIQFAHVSAGASVMENFIEDVVALLPSDLVSILGAHKKTFLEYGAFRVRYDYWQRRVPEKADFIKDCQTSISRLRNPRDSYNDSLTHLMGYSIRTIVEIALSGVNRFDPLKDDLQRTMMTFVMTGNDREYAVSYPGYTVQSLDSAVERLYELRTVSKENMYPQLVTATADLWVTIWRESGRKVKSLPYAFVRKSVLDIEEL